MEPPSFMRSVVDRNVVMRRMPVTVPSSYEIHRFQLEIKKDSVQNVQCFMAAILQAIISFHFSDACHMHRPYHPTWLKCGYYARLHYSVLSTVLSFPLTSKRSRFSVLRHNAPAFVDTNIKQMAKLLFTFHQQPSK